MKQLKWLLLLGILTSGFAFAQGEVDPAGFDLGWLLGMSKNPVALGLLIFGLVQTVKRQAEAHKPPLVWNPWLWRGVAAGFGLICSALLHLWTGQAELGTHGWAGVMIFGIVAAVIAVAGRDGLKTVLSWLGSAGQVTQTTAQVSASGDTVATSITAPAGMLPAPAATDAPPPEAFGEAQSPLFTPRNFANLPESSATHPAFAMQD